MKFYKLISRTVVGTALLGATFGGAFVGTNVNASSTIAKSPTSNLANRDPTTLGGSTSLEVNSNPLSLDSVPNFTFASKNDQNSNQVGLQEGGTLKVTDYRTNDGQGNNVDRNMDNRWTLSVSSNGLSNNNNSDNNDWQINFNKTGITPLSNKQSAPISSNTGINSNVQLKPNDPNNSEPLVSDGKFGVTQVDYGSGTKDASINVPNVEPGHNYTTNINWTLKTTFNSGDNGTSD